MSKAGRNDPCPCGSTRKYKHCCLAQPATAPAAPAASVQQGLALHQAGRLDEAETIYREVLAGDPHDADALHLLGLIAQQTGHNEAAVELIGRAIQVRPQYAVAYNNLGNALKALERADEAMDAHRIAASLDPAFAEAHANLGMAFQVRGQFQESVASYRTALGLKTEFPQAWFGIGLTFQQHGRLQEAITCYDQAIAQQPGYAEAHNNRGAALWHSGLLPQAVQAYREAIRLKPDHADAHHNLGLALMDMREPAQAVESYLQAIRLKPQFFEALSNLAVALQELDRFEEAAHCYRRAYELGANGALVRMAMMLPTIMGTRDEVLAARQVYEENIDHLLTRDIALTDPLEQVGVTSFFLAYHGMNDRELQCKVARFYEKACPTLAAVAAHCKAPRAPGRIRIGFFSKYIYDHSVSRCFAKVVSELAGNDAFEIFLVSPTQRSEADRARTYEGFTGQHVHVPFNLARSREIIAGLQLDFLMYMDIGMEAHSYFLAFARLARVQCVMGGHPVTTGIRNVDHFLTTAIMEPEGADAHYSETLVRFPIGVSYFERPASPARMKTRAELGLPEDAHLYLCPMKLQKMHPDFDEAMARILELDPQGVIVLFEDDRRATWAPRLAARLDRTVPQPMRSRIVFRPWIRDYGDFISANAVSDVVLDPFHFGMGSTLVATFAAGTPIVTRPGEFLRGRGGEGFCRMLGVEECIADDLEGYARRAVRFATDKAFRQAVSEKLAARSHVFYENREPLREFARWLREYPLAERLAA